MDMDACTKRMDRYSWVILNREKHAEMDILLPRTETSITEECMITKQTISQGVIGALVSSIAVELWITNSKDKGKKLETITHFQAPTSKIEKWKVS